MTFYVDVTDLEGTLKKAEGLVAMFADPEGNVIGLARGM